MKTATLDDLQHRLPTVLAWVRGGEDVMVKAPVRPANEAPSVNPSRVDWSQSGALRDRSGEKFLNEEETQELYESLKGESLGNRAYDILQVAAAVVGGADVFLSFDTRQRTLAAAEGLNVGP